MSVTLSLSGLVKFNKKENKIMDVVVEKKRGFGLGLFLILMMIANPLTAFSYFASADMMLELIPHASKTIIYFLGWLCVLNTVFAFAVWHWKKMAILGLYAIVLIIFLINLYLGFGVTGAAPGLIGAVILFLLTRKKMEYFE